MTTTTLIHHASVTLCPVKGHAGRSGGVVASSPLAAPLNLVEPSPGSVIVGGPPLPVKVSSRVSATIV